VRKSDLLAELTDVRSDGVSQDLWLLSIGIENNLWGQYQPFDVNTEVINSKLISYALSVAEGKLTVTRNCDTGF